MQTLLLPPRHNSLTKSELIASYIQQMALPSMWHRVLSESDYELWDTVLEPYSIPAIKFAFDTWIGGAKKFPTPSDITPLCGSYAEQQAIMAHHKIKREEEEFAKKAMMLSPELTFLLAPEIVSRAQNYHARGIEPSPPIKEEEIPGMVQQAKDRLNSDGWTPEVRRFPNGNPIYNRALTQARVLRGVK